MYLFLSYIHRCIMYLVYQASYYIAKNCTMDLYSVTCQMHNHLKPSVLPGEVVVSHCFSQLRLQSNLIQSLPAKVLFACRNSLSVYFWNKYVVIKIIFGWSNQEEWDGRGMQYVWETVEMRTEFRWRGLRQRDHLEDLSVDGRIILKRIFKKWDGRHGLDLSGWGQGHVVGTYE